MEKKRKDTKKKNWMDNPIILVLASIIVSIGMTATLYLLLNGAPPIIK